MNAWQQWRDGTGALLTRPPSARWPSVTIILVNMQGEILWQQRADNGWWALPGGAVEMGESVTQAARRELAEETGYVIHSSRLTLTGIYSGPDAYPFSTYPDRVVQYVSIAFRSAYLTADPPRCSPESLQVGWYHPERLPTPLMPSHLLRMTDALQMLNEHRTYPFVR